MPYPLPALEDFLKIECNRSGVFFPQASYVRKRGFSSLYVRKTRTPINGTMTDVICIANVVATCRGQGNFTRLIMELHPFYNVTVECVLDPLFRKKLERLGFLRLFRPSQVEGAPSYYLPIGTNETLQKELHAAASRRGTKKARRTKKETAGSEGGTETTPAPIEGGI